jgi:hypothetical protein
MLNACMPQDVCMSIWTEDHVHDLMWKVTDVCDPKDCPTPLDIKVEPYKVCTAAAAESTQQEIHREHQQSRHCLPRLTNPGTSAHSVRVTVTIRCHHSPVVPLTWVLHDGKALCCSWCWCSCYKGTPLLYNAVQLEHWTTFN